MFCEMKRRLQHVERELNEANLKISKMERNEKSKFSKHQHGLRKWVFNRRITKWQIFYKTMDNSRLFWEEINQKTSLRLLPGRQRKSYNNIEQWWGRTIVSLHIFPDFIFWSLAWFSLFMRRRTSNRRKRQCARRQQHTGSWNRLNYLTYVVVGRRHELWTVSDDEFQSAFFSGM